MAHAARPRFRRTKSAKSLGLMPSSSAKRSTLAYRLTVARVCAFFGNTSFTVGVYGFPVV